MSGLLTVVVPVHGEPGGVARLLAALDRQVRQGPLPVVVVDDGSPLPVTARLERDSFQSLALELVRSDRNRGPGAARNLGLERVRTPWVAFLDADMIPDEGWLEEGEAAARDPSGADAVEGRVDSRGDSAATPFTHTTDFSVPGTHHGAGNLLVRTDVLRELGGFDERFFDPSRSLHFREDTELHFRLLERGRRIAYEPDLVALHPPHPGSFWLPVRLARRYYFDPLLAREHPERFRRLVRARALGPLSLRRARHAAALLLAGGIVAVGAGALAGRSGAVRAGAAAAVTGWLATAVGISWNRRVGARDAVRVAGVAAVVPWVYLWHHYRGVVRFGHRPRL